MKYIDAGYAAALGTLFAYSISLFVRRRRLTRLAARASRQGSQIRLPEDRRPGDLRPEEPKAEVLS